MLHVVNVSDPGVISDFRSNADIESAWAHTTHENRLIDIVYDIVGYNDPGFTIGATERSVPLPKNILDAASARHRRASHERDNGRIISRQAISRTLSSRYSPDDRNNSNHIPSFTIPVRRNNAWFWNRGVLHAPRFRNMQDNSLPRCSSLVYDILRATVIFVFPPVIRPPLINFTIAYIALSGRTMMQMGLELRIAHRYISRNVIKFSESNFR